MLFQGLGLLIQIGIREFLSNLVPRWIRSAARTALLDRFAGCGCAKKAPSRHRDMLVDTNLPELE